MADIKAFPVVSPTGPHPELVALLEQLLAAAKAGALQGMAYAVAERNGNVVTGWTAMPAQTTGFALLGGLEYLRFRIIQEELTPSPEHAPPWAS
jgi:hypothetical protein